MSSAPRFLRTAALVALAGTRLAAQPAAGARAADTVSGPDTAVVAHAASASEPVSAPPHRMLPRWLAVNGYVTQAAGRSVGGQIAGVPAGGTAALTRAALLARVQPTVADRFVLQLAHRRLGASPLDAYQPELRVDWLFYERSFGDATRARVGRIPFPGAIYNETRNVGTLLPFYTAPSSVYSDKVFATESFDGGQFSHEFWHDHDGFSLEATAYAGAFGVVEGIASPVYPTLPAGVDLATALAAVQAAAAAGVALPGAGPSWTFLTGKGRAHDVVGTTLWANTPVPGLRVGAGAAHARYRSETTPENGTQSVQIAYASVDGTFDHLITRAEVMSIALPSAWMRGGYVQVGGHVAGPLSLYGQIDYARFHIADVPLPPTYQLQSVTYDQARDHAASAVWAFRPNLQLRVEGHLSRDHNAEEGIDVTTAPVRGRRAIVSLSAAF